MQFLPFTARWVPRDFKPNRDVTRPLIEV